MNQMNNSNGPASRNRTHIHGVEDRCIIRYTMAGLIKQDSVESFLLSCAKCNQWP